MKFTVLIPARLASTRLPNKPLADLGGKPMVVRVAERAALAGAQRVVVAADCEEIAQACAAHGIAAVLTRTDHASGSDRLAEACELLKLDGDDIVVNVQGDEPLIEPELISACAATLATHPDCVVATSAHAITELADFHNPNVVKVVLDKDQRALLFSRACIPWWRDGAQQGQAALPTPPAWRHIGIYAYRAGYLRTFPQLAISPLEQIESLEQLRVMWHGGKIAVNICSKVPHAGVDTPEDLLRVRRFFAG